MSLLREAKRCIANQNNHSKLNAFITLADSALVLGKAEDADSEVKSAPHGTGPLHGRLIAVKDNICTADLRTTCASGILRRFTSPYDASVVARLRGSGAIIAGKTNMDEFGMGSHSMYSYFRPVFSMNQDGRMVSAGGSSGGSAVAVATEQCWAALGTDTGGSVRLPAAYTGTVGFKPSYGLLSRWGVVAYANSLDTVGVLGRDVSTVHSVFEHLNAHDSQDPTSLPLSTRARIEQEVQNAGPRPLRIGVPVEYNIEELSQAVRSAWLYTLKKLEALGHTLHPISLPTTETALAAYYVIAPAEASSNLAKYDGVRYGSRTEGPDETEDSVLYAATRGAGFGAEVKRRIVLGAYTLSADAIDNYFLQAQRVRRLVQEDFDRIFAMSNPLIPNASETNNNVDNGERPLVDVLVCPTAPTLAPEVEAVKEQGLLEGYMNDVFTVPASLAGLPAVSVPVPVGSETGPKTGMQVIGQYGNDQLVLNVAAMIERSFAA